MYFYILTFILLTQNWPLLLTGVVGQGLNGNLGIPTLNVSGQSCKFGRPIPGSCKCGTEKEPICGSDLEDYKNLCEFKCAQDCNPSLVKFKGLCKNGTIPVKSRLNFAEWEDKMTEKEIQQLTLTQAKKSLNI